MEELAADTIHELRNPLAAIVYAAELQIKLLKQGNVDSDQLNRSSEIILKSAKQLDEKIRNLQPK